MAAKPADHYKNAKKDFDASWMASKAPPWSGATATPLAVLHDAVRKNLSQLGFGRTDAHGGTARRDAPYSVEVLVGIIEESLRALVSGETGVRPIQATIACALIGELCGGALRLDQKKAGETYPTIANDADWEKVHGPLRLLRNAVCHPASVWTEREEQVPFVEQLRIWIGRDRASPTSQTAERLLAESLGNVNHPVLLRWAVEKVSLMGRYELGRLENALGRDRRRA